MTEEDEQKEREAARLVEQSIRKVCGYVAGGAALFGLVTLAWMGFTSGRGFGVLQPAASFFLATSVVSAARYLGDPIGDPGHRKREERTSATQLPLRLWLGCFAAIWAGVTATQALPGLIAAATAPAPRGFDVRAPAGAIVRVSAGTRTSEISVRLPEGGASQGAVSVRLIQ